MTTDFYTRNWMRDITVELDHDRTAIIEASALASFLAKMEVAGAKPAVLRFKGENVEVICTKGVNHGV